MELNYTILPHTGCVVLPEVNSTSRPGVIYKDISAKILSCLINPNMLCLGNFTGTLANGISLRVIFSLGHGEPYTATRQGAVCSKSSSAVRIIGKRRNTIAQNRDIDHTGSRLYLCVKRSCTHCTVECSLTVLIIEG